MIKLFRTFHPLSALPLFGLALFLHLFNGTETDASLANMGVVPLYRHLLLPADSTLFLPFATNKWLSFILLFSQALLFNKVIKPII